ncbi:Fasciclin domain-containing protein [Sphingobacterium nematocida]|uniref:Fasciclin domain-containing protein n=1 Tax=Sphingobacterium nematocida TaxID=1513896 RepID=A0A1T5GH03_9SPHI|nr:fasciclin domain-containing protein [Sphingobacterium nematocida]SKC07681.1 Fasciclin domain-containing protein [Sphingobacterium nematocida]
MAKFNIKHIFFTVMISLMAFASCKKEYYEDGGVHNPKYEGTILQFLKSRPELFDSLVKVIDLAGYSELLNDPNENLTFFAPANESINNSMELLNLQLYARAQDTVLDLKQVSPEVWKKFLSRYIFKNRYLLKDYPQIDTNDMFTYPGQIYLSIGGEPTTIGTFYNDVSSKNNAGVEQIIKYAGYRQVLIDFREPVATSDIQPNNGVVHVLRYRTHSFGFSAFDFTSAAMSKGITY